MQERTEELAEREQELEAWQARMQSEASKQIGEREGTLQEWQTRLERKQRELGTMQSSLEVSFLMTSGQVVQIPQLSWICWPCSKSNVGFGCTRSPCRSRAC